MRRSRVSHSTVLVDVMQLGRLASDTICRRVASNDWPPVSKSQISERPVGIALADHDFDAGLLRIAESAPPRGRDNFLEGSAKVIGCASMRTPTCDFLDGAHLESFARTARSRVFYELLTD